MNQKTRERERKERIQALGSFGKLKTQVIKDKTKYTRKDKYKGN